MTAIDVSTVPITIHLCQSKMHSIEIHENIPKFEISLVGSATRG